GSEVIWSAPAGNPLNWNEIFNFGMDCSVGPSPLQVQVDEARVGPGLLDVLVNSQGPSGGLPLATVSTVGTPCGQVPCQSSAYEFFASPSSFGPSNHSMTMTYSGGQYTVATGTGTFVAPTGTTLPLSDDSEATVALPFSLPYPGGSTSQLVI